MKWKTATAWAIEQLLDRDAEQENHQAAISLLMEMARRLEGSDVTANVLHPGFVATDLAKNNGPLVRLLMPLIQRNALTPEEGAQTIIYLASSDEVEEVSGEYFGKCKRYRADSAAYDQDAALRLWQVSEEQTAMGPAIEKLEQWVGKANDQGFIPANPVFGKMSTQQWVDLHCRHAELHFGLIERKD